MIREAENQNADIVTGISFNHLQVFSLTLIFYYFISISLLFEEIAYKFIFKFEYEIN